MKVDFRKQELIKRLLILTPELDKRLEELAKSLGVNKSFALRKILEAYFATAES